MTELTLPNGRLPDTRGTTEASVESLATRVRELEALCAEVYVAAVELGFPQPLLNRLWTVGAHGDSPHAYQLDMPQRLPPPGAPIVTAKNAEPIDIPHISLSERPKGSDSRAKQPELKPLPQRKTVMVVDDDPMMLEVLVRILKRENFNLLTAASGPQALKATETTTDPIDLLVTDYAMPEMHGRELANKMRERHADLKVLYQTGFSDMLFEDRVELEENAAFVEKPFTARGLREAARFILFGTVNPE